MERLKGVKLEDYTKRDIEERFVAYGTDEELQDSTIQRLLIKHDFIDSFIDAVDIITNKQVIQDLLADEVVKKNNLTIIVGEIIDIDKQVYITCQGTDVYCSVVKFRDSLTNATYEIKHQLLLDNDSLEEYKSKLEPYIKGVAAIVTHKGDDLLLRCYLKKYDDIDYTNISTYNT